MKKISLIALFALVCNFAMAQIESTTYKGAFAPAPTAMWTNSWTNFDPGNTAYADASTVVNVSGTISTSTTWTAGRTYKLNGLVYVANNATLTIEPGVVVKGVYNSAGTALIITKGAKINAIGTENAPIVFTSAKTIAQGRSAGDWGGIILLGKAGFNLAPGTNNIEGITANANTEYGGGTTPNHADNSGTLKYVRIEYAGFVFSPNNEINGLTMGAVGSGTTIDYVQVSYANDDAFEWFGGAVNCKHLVSYKNLDDDFDTDNGFKGSVQFGLILRDPAIADNPAISTSEGFESDNNAAGADAAAGYENTTATFSNITAIGPKVRATIAPTASIASGYERALRIRRNSQLKIINSIFMDFKKNYLFVDGSTTVDKVKNRELIFKNNIMAGSSDGVAEYAGGVNFAGASGAAVYKDLKLNGTGADITPNAWFTGNGNSVLASSTTLLTAAYGTSSAASAFASLDYRPATDSPALSGADFTGFVVNVNAPVGDKPVVVATVTYCKGAIAAPLTATLTSTGLSLKWYTKTNDVYTAIVGNIAPTPSTANAATTVYGVTQMVDGVESAKSDITVTVNAFPTTTLSPIKGLVTSGVAAAVTTDVSTYVGTTTSVVYSVALSAADTSVSGYTWTVPAGVTIVSGQGTEAITVNFKTVPQGLLTIGDITVKAKNASDCFGAAVKVSLIAKLPVAASTVTLKNGTATVASYGAFMGTDTPLTLSTTAVAGATSYEWDLPAGVTVSIPGGVNPDTSTDTYTAAPFVTTNSAPSTVGTKYWEVTKNTYTYTLNSVVTTTTTSTAVQKIFGGYKDGALLVETPKLYEFAVSGSLAAAVAAGNTYTYTAAGVTTTYTVRTAVTAGTSKKIVCTASDSKLSATDGTLTGTLTASGTTSGDISFVGFKFTSAVVAYGPTTQQEYMPYGGTKVITDKPAVLIKLAGVTDASRNELYLGVTAKNGVGFTSTDNNTNPDAAIVPGHLWNVTYTETFTPPSSTGGTATQSGVNAISVFTATGHAIKTSKLVKFLAGTAPAAPTALTLNNGTLTTAITVISKFLGQGGTYRLTAALNALASSYTWELPASVTRVTSLTDNTPITNLSSTSNSIFIRFNGTAPAAGSIYFGVKAVNAIGSSVTDNSASTVIPATTSTATLLKLVTAVPVAPTTLTLNNGTAATAITAISALIGQGGTFRLSAAVSALASSYTWELPACVTRVTTLVDGVLTDSATSTDAFIFVKFNGTAPAAGSIYFGVKAVNAVGSSVTNNSASTVIPATTSTAKLLKVTATLPTVVATVSGSLSVCNRSNGFSYTITRPTGATKFRITAPAGSVVSSTNGVATATSGSSTNNVLTTTDLTFKVVYDGTAAFPLTDKSLVIRSINAMGDCATALSKTLTKLASCSTLESAARIAAPKASVSATEVYPNPVSSDFNIDVTAGKAGAFKITIYSLDNNLVASPRALQLQEGDNAINENVSSLKKGIYIVRLVNDATGEVITKKLVKN